MCEHVVIWSLTPVWGWRVGVEGKTGGKDKWKDRKWMVYAADAYQTFDAFEVISPIVVSQNEWMYQV